MNGMDLIKALNYLDDDLISDASGEPESVKGKAKGGGIKAPKPQKPNGGGVKVKALVIGICAIVAAVAIVFVVLFATGVFDTKVVPVYQGMVISSAEGTTSDADTAAKAAASYGYHGDYNGKNDDLDKNDPYGTGSNDLQNEVQGTLVVTGAGEDIYYADAGDDIYITIKFYNPDYYDIISFVLTYGNSEVHYSSYMFETGSDYENIIIKLNVGTTPGIIDYTISQIKYIDGTTINDVQIDGDTVVSCGVRASTSMVTASISSEKTTLTSISFTTNISDYYSLIEYCGGSIAAILYNGENIIETQTLALGTNTVTFTNLSPDTLYQYAVVAYYDDLSGTGAAINYLYTNAVYTDAVVLFDNIEVGQEGVTFAYDWYSGYSESTITKLTLTLNGVTTDLDASALTLSGLYSDTEYTLTAYYIGNNSETTSISLTFTTLAKAVPTVEITTLTSEQESVDYALSITDTDSVGSLTSVTLTLNGSTVDIATAISGTFGGLLSDNTYTITAVYTYDLNDGTGTHTVEVTQSIATKAKATPVVVISDLTSEQESVSYVLTITDTDAVGSLTSVTLTLGNTEIGTATAISGTFGSLLSDNTYTVTAVYTYDLNDGTGSHTVEVTQSIATKAKATPVVAISDLTSTQESVSYALTITDTDAVGSLTSVTLTLGNTEIGTATAISGTFGNLLSDNTYTITIVYTYDLNDGTGSHTVEVTEDITTEAKATPVVVISDLTSEQESVSYALAITDTDSVGSLTSVTLALGSITVNKLTASGTFSGLLSDNTYTVTAVYTYNLNDGTGSHTVEVTKTIATKAKATPVVVISDLTSTQESVSYELAITDTDSVGSLTSVTLSLGNKEIDTATTISGTFSSLLSNNTYTVTAVYTYDLNDGTGTHTAEVTQNIATLAKEVPTVEISTLTSEQESIDYALTITDTDSVGSLTSVTLSLGNKEIDTATAISGTFSSLLSNNTYTVTAVYTYDLNDGTGSHTVEVTKTIATKAKAVPTVEITVADTDTYGLTFNVAYTDTDGVGEITAIGLYNGNSLVEDISDLTQTQYTFANLSSYTQYTLKVDYKYNLNDGVGEQKYTEELSEYTEPSLTLNSVTFINSSAISEGDTIVLRASVNNPDGVKLNSVVVNGETYAASALGTDTSLVIEILYSDQFDGGDTVLTITQINCTIDEKSYSLAISESNTANVFIYGELAVEDFSVARYNSTSGLYEQTDYGFKSEQLYYQISLSNATGYSIDTVTINSTVYDASDMTISSDYQTVIIKLTSTSQSQTLSSITYSYGTSSFSKTEDTTTTFMRLSVDEDGITKISTADDLMNMTDKYAYGYYKLVNDIDLSGYTWVNLDNAMCGVFDGNGYTISSIGGVITCNNTSINIGLFSYVKGVVTNLTIKDMLYIVTLNNTTDGTYDIYAGGIAAQGEYLYTSNVEVSASIKVINTAKSGAVYLGGLFGKVSDAYRTDDVTVNTILAGELGQATGIYIGGLYGNYEARGGKGITNVTVNLTVNLVATSNTQSSIGGIIGTTSIYSGFTISNATVKSTVTVAYKGTYTYYLSLGGVVGHGSEMYGILSLYDVTSYMTADVTYYYIAALTADEFVNEDNAYIDESCSGTITITETQNADE